MAPTAIAPTTTAPGEAADDDPEDIVPYGELIVGARSDEFEAVLDKKNFVVVTFTNGDKWKSTLPFSGRGAHEGGRSSLPMYYIGNVDEEDEENEDEEEDDEEDEAENEDEEDEDTPEGADAPGTGVAGGVSAGRGGVNGRAGAADIAQRLGENTADVRDTLRATVEAAATTMRQDNAAAPSWRKEMLSNVQEKMEIQKLMGSHTSNLASVYSNSYVATPMAKRPRTMGIEGDFHAVRGSKPPGSFAALFEPRVEQTTYAGGDVFSAAEKAADPRYALLHGRRPSASTYLAPDLAASSGTFRQLQSQARSNRYDGNIDGPSEQSSLSIQNPNHARNMAHRVAAEFSHAPPQSRQTAGVLNRNQQTPVSNITIANRGSTSSDPSTAFRAGQPRRRR